MFWTVYLWLDNGLCRNNKHDQAAVKTGCIARTANRNRFHQPTRGQVLKQQREGSCLPSLCVIDRAADNISEREPLEVVILAAFIDCVCIVRLHRRTSLRMLNLVRKDEGDIAMLSGSQRRC